jgi:protease-4
MEQNNSVKKPLMSKKTIFFIFILIFSFAIGIKNFAEKPILIEDSIGKILIEGALLDTTDLLKKLEILEFNPKLKGLIVEIDSPGGAIVPSYQLYEKLKKISKKKPLIIVMKSVAASGGYLISLAGEKIFAHPSTITGSIGVIFFKADFRELMNKIGIQPLVFKSGKLKASPNFIEGSDKDSDQMMERIIFNTKKQFLDLVLERRKINNQEIIQDIENSGIYLGSEAKAIGLIDDLGGIEDAYNWIVKEKNLNFPLKEIDIKDKNRSSLIKKILGSSIAINNMNFDFINKNFILNRENGLYLMYDY